MTEISPQQRQALEASEGSPIEIFDSEQNQHYILLRAEMFESLKSALILEELTADERQVRLQTWGKASGWEEPADTVFDDIEPTQ